MLKQLINPKSDTYLKVKNHVLTSNFNWYYEDHFIGHDSTSYGRFSGGDLQKYNDISFLTHPILSRPLPGRKWSAVTSDFINPVSELINEIDKVNQLKIRYIIRINANMIFPSSGKQYTIPHTDHDFPHKNMLIYLTDAGGETFFGKEVHYPKEDDIIIGEGLHHFRLPKKDRRIVLVLTYF